MRTRGNINRDTFVVKEITENVGKTTCALPINETHLDCIANGIK